MNRIKGYLEYCVEHGVFQKQMHLLDTTDIFTSDVHIQEQRLILYKLRCIRHE